MKRSLVRFVMYRYSRRRNGRPTKWSACWWERKTVSISGRSIDSCLRCASRVGGASNRHVLSTRKELQYRPSEANAFPEPRKVISMTLPRLSGEMSRHVCERRGGVLHFAVPPRWSGLPCPVPRFAKRAVPRWAGRSPPRQSVSSVWLFLDDVDRAGGAQADDVGQSHLGALHLAWPRFPPQVADGPSGG